MRNHRHPIGCRPEDHPRIARRGLLQVGGLSLIGASLADLLRLEAQAATMPPARRGRARAVIFIFQAGGPSQHETWDPKPDAPAEIRGEYRPISSTVEGLRVCEYLPRLAQRARKYAIVRTLHHPADRSVRNEHNSTQYLIQTGTCQLPPGEAARTIAMPRPRPLEWPSIGSMIAYALPHTSGSGLPPVIHLPRGGGEGPGQRPGMLGARYARWSVDLAPPCHTPDGGGSCPNCFSHDQPNDPARAPGNGPKAWWDNSSCRNPDFHLPDLSLPQGLTVSRLENRRALLERVGQLRRDLDKEPQARDLDIYRRQAMELVLAQRGKKNPFDLTQESDRTRDLYGREEWGQAFLVARRLVEVGVRMVQVNLRGWDTHQNAFRDLKGHLLPSLDRCLSGFLDDLEVRGLLEETLIVMCGEMGRTPVISPISTVGVNASGEPFTPGRHHWGDVFPCFFAGGGIRPGQVIGKTDPTGGLPDSEAYTPADMAATIFHLLGVGPEQEFRDTEGRPYRIYQGVPIAPLLS